MSYKTENPPLSLEQTLAQFLLSEFSRIAGEFETGVENILLPELNVAPAKPRTGMIVLADGTNWNPGSGAGFYGYRGGSWVFLG